jgi:GDP-4-dehydro-6-deoxy-D-mannose reductase
MRALVTGITGFVGGHLAEDLVAHGDHVIGCSRTGNWPHALAHLSEVVQLVPCDLGDGEATARLLADHPVDAIYHLAGLANPRACADDPTRAARENVLTTQNVCDGVLRSGRQPRFLFVSTGYVYGHPSPEHLPIGVDAPVRAEDPYAASKWAAEQCTIQFAEKTQIPIVRVRPFNHAGPRQSPGYIVSDWTRQVVEIESGRVPPVLRVGNLDTRRDYTDVRDIVRAYRMLAHESRAFTPRASSVYNLGSGFARSGREVLETLRSISDAEWDWETDPRLLRPGEADVIVADAKPLQELIGWKPEIDFRDTLRDTRKWLKGEAE